MFSGSTPTQSQRAQELRRFFVPFDPLSSTSNAGDGGFNSSILEDGALACFAEIVAWRLGSKRAMVSLIDRDTQYFLAGATLGEASAEQDGLWFGSSSMQMPESLCKNTLALQDHSSEFPCFVINDLRSDRRFCNLPIVDGSIAAFRFYAGTPITTNRGVRIGSFFVFDDDPRPDGLSSEHQKFLSQSASRVMRHLEVHREAAERRRITLMSKGIAKFLEGKPLDVGEDELNDNESKKLETDEGSIQAQTNGGHMQGKSQGGPEELIMEASEADQPWPDPRPQPQLDNQVEDTFYRAARLLRESLEIGIGGVIFFDTAVGFREAGVTNAHTEPKTDLGAQFQDTQDADRQSSRHPAETNRPLDSQYQGQVRNSEDQGQAVGVLAASVAKVAKWEPLDGKTLQSLLKSYPQGNVWYYDKEGYFSSLEQLEQASPTPATVPSERRRSVAEIKHSRKSTEAQMLLLKFKEARQIIFLPLWDAAARRWYSGCFVWSKSPVPVFTVESEIAYLAAFTNSVMAEISRLDAIRSDQAKADFISSISHEIRSPLHGILASADFLRELTSEEPQVELISTVQHCGRTLLDTINHILDFSKINSFEKVSSKEDHDIQGGLPTELHAITNVAVLCEEVVDGMIAANRFNDSNGERGNIFATTEATAAGPPMKDPVKVVLDLQHRDWRFVIQPGALRRIIMNIFGNAQKYTEKGFIRVTLRAQDGDHLETADEDLVRRTALSLTIQDSGRGMSSEYLQQKLYSPFAQEDTFASGLGLGLSIVWSIVKQLGGTVSISSLLGKGTQVSICLPLQEYNPPNRTRSKVADSTYSRSPFQQAETCLDALRKFAPGKTIALQQRKTSKGDPTPAENMVFDYTELYLAQWYGFTVTTFSALNAAPVADLIVAVEDGQDQSQSWADQSAVGRSAPVLLITDRDFGRERTRQLPHGVYAYYTRPVGPYKFAKCLSTYFEKLENAEAFTNSSTDDSRVNVALTEDAAISSGAGEKQFLPYSERNASMESRGLVKVQRPTTPSSLPLRTPFPTESNNIGADQVDGVQDPSNEKQTARNTPGQGTVLSKALASTEIADHGAPHQPSLRILIVEDNEVNLQLLQRFLTKQKGDIIELARNGYEAVAAAQKALEPYDVIFMDISMPGIDGFETTRQIRFYEADLRVRTSEEPPRSGKALKPERKQQAYIVALTGLGAGRDRDEAVKSGFNEFLTKPIPFQKVGRMLNERRSIGRS